ncbi:MAG: hypothetical protein LBO66_01045, partial [Deltaproteobacteria bacterium]|nr:hypothetical protein [Deltaproteobacteria bacterium]
MDLPGGVHVTIMIDAALDPSPSPGLQIKLALDVAVGGAGLGAGEERGIFTSLAPFFRRSQPKDPRERRETQVGYLSSPETPRALQARVLDADLREVAGQPEGGLEMEVLPPPAYLPACPGKVQPGLLAVAAP